MKTLSTIVLAALLFAGNALPMFAQADRTVTVGDTTCFDLTARDENGFIIRDWDITGSPITIILQNSEANTDSSTMSWNDDPDAYTWAKFLHNGTELTPDAVDNQWILDNTLFVEGKVTICLVHTRADSGVFYEIEPKKPFLNQVSETIDFVYGDLDNYLVDITRPIPGQDAVYHFRKYEIVVTPRDRFLNPIEGDFRTLFSARFPGEFVNSQPELSDIFSGTVFIDKPTNYFLASTASRELPNGQLQSITAYNVDDPTIRGITPPYEILRHPPYDFVLQTPTDGTEIIIGKNDARRVDFSWERPSPPDPYTDVLISAFTGERGTDIINYEVSFIDSTSLTQAQVRDSDNLGLDPTLSYSRTQLIPIGDGIAGTNQWFRQPVYWFASASDGLYTTNSTQSPAGAQPPGFLLVLIRDTTVAVDPVSDAPESFQLEQNYPNPFNPSTTIKFSIVKGGEVSLKVYDLVGNEVAELVNEPLTPGVYTTAFHGINLPSGVYIYRLQANGNTITKRMVLTK
ncbi:MAG: hypothetical protein CL946_07510 [Ectothiorhodospiraceae bacterium]|nr:hypothetical protein [Ectothiorhodospiraceae bacterium]